MSSNPNVQLTTIDFGALKGSLIGFLQTQDNFKDYNFEGSALNTLIDLLVYNTQYNAFYLNMVSNEMFLDSSVQRSSVVSHAKKLDYTPKSAIAPTAFVDITFNNVTASSLTLPAYSTFSSASIGGVNYTFVNPTSYAVNTANNVAVFNSVEIKQGVSSSFKFTVDVQSNPKQTFEIPDAAIDTTTLQISVQKSGSDSTTEIYKLSTSFLGIDGTSKVFFLEEALNGNYVISFGDGVLGKKLEDGNIVVANYISTEGTASAGANSFVLMQTVNGFSPSSVASISAATTGGDKESIESIKFVAPKAYSAQNRAVTKDDYITLIQKNSLGFSFDAVNVWGGEENDPPVYGQVFVSLKPTGAYTLTPTQKAKIAKEVIAPISVLTVSPNIVDPDYNYIQVKSSVLYNSKATNYTSSQIAQLVTSAIQQFSATKLNTFNSTFTAADLIGSIQGANPSIVTNDTSIRLQKKFFPVLGSPTTYNLFYGTPLKKGILTSGVTSAPALQFQDQQDATAIIDGVYVEETPSTTGGVSSISLLNPGFNYTAAPVVTILGDGVGAKAEATVIAGSIASITVTEAGTGYTQAVISISPAVGDNSGAGGSAVAILDGQFGTLRTYYYNNQNIKTILSANVGTIDYINGVITLKNFNPVNVDNALGQFTISVEPSSTIINSTLNKILTVDTFDPNAVLVNVTAKT